MKTMLIAILIYVSTGSILSAQAVGKKDLSQESPSSSPASGGQPQDYCAGGGGIADGVEIIPDDPVLSLTISKAELVLVNRKQSIEMTVVLKNHGIGPALIPWTTAPVTPAQIAVEGNEKEVGYEAATVDFFIGPPHTSDPSLKLRSHVALWSQPQNPSQSIKLLAGQWVEIRTHADVICRLSAAMKCTDRLRDKRLQVSGWWYQRLITHTTKNGCILRSGAYTQREIDSKTTSVEYGRANKSTDQ